jgi:hypothetical protein
MYCSMCEFFFFLDSSVFGQLFCATCLIIECSEKKYCGSHDINFEMSQFVLD